MSVLLKFWGRRTLERVEAWTKSNDWVLYGGNAEDGQLFQLGLATAKVKNLGKPIMMNRFEA